MPKLPKDNAMFDVMKNMSNAEPTEIEAIEEPEVKEEPLSKDDLSLVKKALGSLQDVKSENSELNGIISSLTSFYKVQNKTALPEKEMKFEATPQPASTVMEGNTGMALNEGLQ